MSNMMPVGFSNTSRIPPWSPFQLFRSCRVPGSESRVGNTKLQRSPPARKHCIKDLLVRRHKTSKGIGNTFFSPSTHRPIAGKITIKTPRLNAHHKVAEASVVASLQQMGFQQMGLSTRPCGFHVPAAHRQAHCRERSVDRRHRHMAANEHVLSRAET